MSELDELRDQQAIIDVVNGVAIYADLREWDLLRRLYADEVAVDYTSLAGGELGRVRADDLIASWHGLGDYQATQHLIGNHRVRVTGDTAEVLVYVRARHWLPQPGDPGAAWTVHGYYDYVLTRTADTWQITRHKFTATMVYGHRALLEREGVRAEWLT